MFDSEGILHRSRTQGRLPFWRKALTTDEDYGTKKIRTFFSRTFHCLSLDPSNSALLLYSSRSRTRSFSSSCVRIYGRGAEELPWETCGLVDAVGSGEPEVDSPSSSSSESMVNSFGGSGTEIPSPCGTGRRADGIFGYTTVHFFFIVMPPETGGTIQK